MDYKHNQPRRLFGFHFQTSFRDRLLAPPGRGMLEGGGGGELYGGTQWVSVNLGVVAGQVLMESC